MERWDGMAWTRVESPNAGHSHSGSLSGVVALAADDVWAVGAYADGGPTLTLIEHWDGTAWTVVPSPNKGPYPNDLSAVSAVAPDDIWAVGTWFTKAFDDRTLTLTLGRHGVAPGEEPERRAHERGERSRVGGRRRCR